MNTHPTYRISQVIAASDEYTAPIFHRSPLDAPLKCSTCKGSTYVITGHGEFAGAEECPACIGGQTAAIAATAATGETS